MIKKIKQKINDKIFQIENKITSEDLKIIREYNGYPLDKSIRDYVPWHAGNCMVKETEDILFTIYYRNQGSIIEEADGANWFGNNSILIYIVKEKEKIKIKYLNLRTTEEKAMKTAGEIITNLDMYQIFDIGYNSKQYREYIRKEKMKEINVSEEIYSQIEKLGEITYDKMQYFSYSDSSESIDYCDYVNKKYFFCDEYCLKQYKPCVEFVEEIIKKCNILNLEQLNIQYFEEPERTTIMKKLIEEAIEEDSQIM